jgi:hypothetical protein
MYIVEFKHLGQSLPAQEINKKRNDKSPENLRIRDFRQRQREKQEIYKNKKQ